MSTEREIDNGSQRRAALSCFDVPITSATEHQLWMRQAQVHATLAVADVLSQIRDRLSSLIRETQEIRRLLSQAAGESKREG